MKELQELAFAGRQAKFGIKKNNNFVPFSPITSERVDDIPLLLAQLEYMGVQELLDEHFPTHGNWQGLSIGGVATIWLVRILSLGDHRLNHVQSWADARLYTLSKCTDQAVRALDFSDDRLADVLKFLSDDEQWESFETDLNQRQLRVYDLNSKRVRLDSTTGSGYCKVTSDGLFQFGHSKDKRSDLPQVKVMLSVLDPMGLPLVTDVLPGDRADDPLYIPAISKVRESVQRQELLYVGDCKMAAFSTRAFLQAGEDFYLCPLPKTQLKEEVFESYLARVWTGEQSLVPIYREKKGEEAVICAEGYECIETLSAVVDGEIIRWNERRLIVRSFKHAKTEEKNLRIRLEKAQAALLALNKRGRGRRRFTDVESLKQAAEQILTKCKVEGLFSLNYRQEVHKRSVRRYGQRPARVEVERDVWLEAAMDEKAVEDVVRLLGWRVYVTNQPLEQLPLSQAVLAYRNEYIIERGFGRLKGRPLSLIPMYLERDDHATGLIRLLSIGLRVLTLLEFVVRGCLAAEQEELAGLYAGNPKRATARPTAELLLEAFEGITLTVIQEENQVFHHLTPLSKLQRSILVLLSFPLDTYTKLCDNFPEPP